MMERDRTQQNRRRFLLLGVGTVVSAAALLLVLFYCVPRREAVDLRPYVTVGRDASGEPNASIDRDALLKTLHLPTSAEDPRAAERLADVRAISNMSVYLSYTGGSETMRVSVQADTDTLKRYGIGFSALSWDQEMRGYVAGSSDSAANASVEPETAEPTEAPQNGALLRSLVDADGNGYNLRAVCELVQEHRDRALRSLFGDAECKFEKLHVIFSVNDERTQNCYQAVYRAQIEIEGEKAGDPQYFTVFAHNLTLTENGVVAASAAVGTYRNEANAKKAPYGNATVLSGGGMKVVGKRAFDQNGFVQFPDSPTSYRMANGVYWSPTYDALDEDQIWKLTAVEGHSMANLLRYARKEIYARYYAGFDERTEREFYEHYNSFSWYREMVPDRTADMTETERNNVRLLREIQSFIEK